MRARKPKISMQNWINQQSRIWRQAVTDLLGVLSAGGRLVNPRPNQTILQIKLPRPGQRQKPLKPPPGLLSLKQLEKHKMNGTREILSTISSDRSSGTKTIESAEQLPGNEVNHNPQSIDEVRRDGDPIHR